MNILNRSLLSAAIGLAFATVSAGGFAQAFDAVQLYGAAPDEDGGLVGLALVYGRAYRGSNERQTSLFPVLDYQWRSGWFAGTTNGLGLNFSKDPQAQYGLRVTADLGRHESRSVALTGLGDVEVRPEIGGFFNYYVSREVFVTSSLRYGSGNGRRGLVVDLGTGYSTAIAPGWQLGAGVAMSLVNRAYMQSFFGIDAVQASSSAYAVYTPSAGVRDVRANAALTYTVTPRVRVTGAVSFSGLQGDAKGSPIVRQATTANGVLAATYAF